MRRDALATGFRSAPRSLLIVFSKRTSRGFIQRRRRPHRIGDIGDIGAAFWDRAVAITITTITIGWLMAIGPISIKRASLGDRASEVLHRAASPLGRAPRTPQLCKQIPSDRMKDA